MSEPIIQISNEEVNEFIEAIKNYSDYDFIDYSIKSFTRRIERVLVDTKLDIPTLIAKIKKDKEFMEATVKAITVNTTELFRDPAVWQNLRYRVLPRFQEQTSINIWHVGCSTGQEVYSMLILLEEMNLFEKAKVFATDLNTDVIEVAKKGEYKFRYNMEYLESFNKVIRENPYNYEEYVEVPYSKYFDIDKAKDIFIMKPYLRKKIIFRKHDLVKDENVFNTKFDIIMCRNVLIYFNSQLQNRIFEFFYENLFKNGCLVLGAHESMLGPITTKYKKKGLVYIKK